MEAVNYDSLVRLSQGTESVYPTFPTPGGFFLPSNPPRPKEGRPQSERDQGWKRKGQDEPKKQRPPPKPSHSAGPKITPASIVQKPVSRPLVIEKVKDWNPAPSPFPAIVPSKIVTRAQSNPNDKFTYRAPDAEPSEPAKPQPKPVEPQPKPQESEPSKSNQGKRKDKKQKQKNRQNPKPEKKEGDGKDTSTAEE